MNHKAMDEKLAANIERHGYTMIGVFADGAKPAFFYTIGLTQRGWPEVVMIGNVHPAIAEQVLKDLIAGWAKKEKVIMGDNMGLIVFKDDTEHAVRVIEANNSVATVHYATGVKRYYPDENITFVQALLPDRFGRFPDEPEYDQSKQAQPLIK